MPVTLGGQKSLKVASCLKKQRFWSVFKLMSLKQNMYTLETETDFATWLFDVGKAKSGKKAQLPLMLSSHAKFSRITI